MTNNNFEEVLLDRAVIRGGLHLYRCCDAMMLVSLCNENNIQVLGIDAFFISNGKTHPKMGNSIDLSFYNLIEANNIAYRFLEKQAGLDLLFEIIY